MSLLQEVWIQDMHAIALRILVANDISGIHGEGERLRRSGFSWK